MIGQLQFGIIPNPNIPPSGATDATVGKNGRIRIPMEKCSINRLAQVSSCETLRKQFIFHFSPKLVPLVPE